MKILIAMDTDGTFFTTEDNSEYICGIIDKVKLKDKILQDFLNDTLEIRVVSESPFYPKTESGLPYFSLCNDQANRYYNLMKSKEEYREIHGSYPDICIYVDDLDIWKKEAHNAGFAFINAEKFADSMGVRHV